MSDEMTREHPYSASFRLYDPAGLQVLFTVRADEGPAHLDQLTAYMAELTASGYAVNLPGTEPGEQVEEVDAWVLGETSRDEPCVYLYSSNAGLKWRIATVYVEDLAQLPFKPTGDPVIGAAPEREAAAKRGWLHVVEPFKIVMKPTGKQTDAGRDVMRFDRVLGSAPATPAASQATPPTGNGSSNGNGQGKWTPAFVAHVCKNIPYYSGLGDIERAAKAASIKPPTGKADAPAVFEQLERYASQQADAANGDPQQGALLPGNQYDHEEA